MLLSNVANVVEKRTHHNLNLEKMFAFPTDPDQKVRAFDPETPKKV